MKTKTPESVEDRDRVEQMEIEQFSAFEAVARKILSLADGEALWAVKGETETKFAFAVWKEATVRIAELEAEVAAGKALFANMTVIEGKYWSIANNGNPARLIALRQFDDGDNTLSYTHHDSVLEAFTALTGKEKQQ